MRSLGQDAASGPPERSMTRYSAADADGTVTTLNASWPECALSHAAVGTDEDVESHTSLYSPPVSPVVSPKSSDAGMMYSSQSAETFSETSTASDEAVLSTYETSK